QRGRRPPWPRERGVHHRPLRPLASEAAARGDTDDGRRAVQDGVTSKTNNPYPGPPRGGPFLFPTTSISRIRLARFEPTKERQSALRPLTPSPSYSASRPLFIEHSDQPLFRFTKQASAFLCEFRGQSY